MKITRRMEWPYKDKFGSLEEVSEYFQLLYQTLTEESALRAVELDVAYTDGYNVFLGHEAGQSNTISLDDTEGVYNVFIGHQAGYSNTTGIKNIAIGYSPLYTNTTGSENTALGSEALYSNTSGANNVALGNDALYTNATGNYNVAVGFEVLKVSTANNNVAVGYQALVKSTADSYNVALGTNCLSNCNGGTQNLAVGDSALEDVSTGDQNTGVGCDAGLNIQTGSNNVVLGFEAGAILNTGSGNVFLGSQAGAQETGSNKLYVDNSNTTTPLIYGEFDNGIVDINGHLSVKNGNEFRYWDSGSSHYVGFEAPALTANCVWVWPAVDGNASEVLTTDGSKNLSFSAAGSGDVTAGANLTDHAIVRGDGGIKGVQTTGITIADTTNNMSGVGDVFCNALTSVTTLTATTAKLTNLTDGYVPYHVDDATGLANSSIFTDGTDVTIKRAAAKSVLNIDTYDTTPTDFSQLIFRTSDSDTIDTLSETQDGDTIGRVVFQGVDDGDTWQAGARITAVQNTAAGTGEVPTDLVLETYSATAINTDQLILKKGGNVTISRNFVLTSATSTITGGAQLSIEAGAGGIKSQTIHDDTSVAAANITQILASGNTYALYRSTSARKYKDKIKDLELDSSLIYNLLPRSFDSLGKADNKNKRFHGLVADEIEQVYPEIIAYGKNNEAESYDNQMLTTLMLAEIQKHEARIEALEAV